MEQSSLSTLEVLRNITSSSDFDEVTNILPALVDCFEREEESNIVPEVISFLLGPAFQVLPIQDVDEAILQPFLPRVKHFISKKLSAIHSLLGLNILEDSLVPEIKKNLEICVQLLTDVDKLLSYVVSLNNVSVTDIFNMPRNVADIVYQVFTHCQKSKSEYKETFTAVRSELIKLFQQCHKVQLNLFTLLCDKLTFNCTYENELLLLVDVLDILSLMAEVVAELDTMSLVAHWKTYAQITQTYSTHLCSRLTVDRTIKYLAVNINHQLSSLNNFVNNEKKAILRCLKITSLQLKVLIKFCEHYKGHLGDCHVELLDCLISLAGHTSQYLEQQGVAPDISAQVTTHLCAGVAPLLTFLIMDPLFVKEYLHYADKIQLSSPISQVGYCHLTNMILKKLIQLSSKDDDIHDLWLKPTLPLVGTTFKLLHQCSTSGELVVVVEDDIYQALLVHIAAFIVATCSSDIFPQLERLLMMQLLQPLLCPALFSSDLLCLIARFGSSDLCQQLTCLLSDVLSTWPAYDRHRPEWVYVSWTQGRLVQLLSSNHLQAFTSRLPSLPRLASDINTLLNMSFSDESVQLFQSLVDRFALVGDNLTLLSDTDCCLLADAVYQLWQCVSVPPEALSIESSHWFLGFFSVVIMATSNLIHSLNNCQIGHILDALMKMTNVNTTLLLCGACEFLRRLATKTFTSDASETLVCQKISFLFVQLLQDKSQVKKQVALETFSYFAYVTKYEQIVANTVAKNSQLQVVITDYFESVPTVQSDKHFLEHVKCLNHNFVHKCKVKKKSNEPEVDNLIPNPCKKLKISISEGTVSATLQRIEKDLDLLEEYSSNKSINKSQACQLQSIFRRLDRIANTI